MNRSPATVLHTVRKHDREHPDRAVFAQAPGELDEAERLKILRGYRRGLSLKSLARRACRPRSAVYRVIVEETVARLEKRKVKFIDDPLYHADDADAAIAAILSQENVIDAGISPAAPRPEEARLPRDLPPYLQALYRTPLLSPARERALFLAFNYHKCRFVTARRRLDPHSARARDLNEMEHRLRRATALKNQIVQANLRLVVSVARKHLRPGLSMMELVSEGNLTLMRAVESFDVHRGHRFSTYATLALMKGFARTVPQMLAQQRAAGGNGGGGDATDALSQLPDRRLASAGDRLLDREEVGALLSRLSDRERAVLRGHYGLGDDQAAPATYDQLARRLGLSRQRVCQIEQSALTKLRQAVGVNSVTPNQG
jgi:RNA polymerase primary sigma factor